MGDVSLHDALSCPRLSTMVPASRRTIPKTTFRKTATEMLTMPQWRGYEGSAAFTEHLPETHKTIHIKQTTPQRYPKD